MARRHGGLGRGLDALIPMREEVEKAMRSADSEGVEILFADDEETDIASKKVPSQISPRDLSAQRFDAKEENEGFPVEYSQNVSRETMHVLEHKEQEQREQVQKEPVFTEERPAEQTGNWHTEVKAPEIAEPASDVLKDAGSEHSGQEPVTVRISEVEPNREQPRKHFDEEKLAELSESIKTYGILQPILVQRKKDYYEIIAGERRWRAALKAGLKEIPVIIREYSDREILELSLIENIQREDLNPIEEAEAYKRLMDEFGMSQEEMAGRVSKSRSAVANSLRLLKLQEEVRRMLIDGQISMGHARALLPLEIVEEQIAAAHKVADRHLSVRDTEKMVRDILKTSAAPAQEKNRPAEPQEDPSIQVIYKQIEDRLQQTLHTKVQIQRKRNGHGKLLIDFYSSDDLDKIIDRLTDRG